MPLAFLLLVVPSVTFSVHDLRAQIARLTFGFLILVIGLAALALFFFRRKTRDLTLLSLGIAAVLMEPTSIVASATQSRMFAPLAVMSSTSRGTFAICATVRA